MRRRAAGRPPGPCGAHSMPHTMEEEQPRVGEADRSACASTVSSRNAETEAGGGQ
jgi:hypothetical protein